jgi:outer membrane immunogenic protein
MRRLFVAFLSVTTLSVVSALCGVAVAADAYGAYNWTGFYLGGLVGGGWETSQATRADNLGAPNEPLGFMPNPIHEKGLLGGGYAGFNYQINKFVLGIEGDYSLSNLRGSETTVGLIGAAGTATYDIKWVATLAGRLGYAINNWMFFGKGGWAWQGVSASSLNFNAAGTLTSTSAWSNPPNGWTIGTGMEWVFAPNWSAKLEYDFVKFSTAHVTVINTNIATSAVTSFALNSAFSLNIVKLGVAYRF